MPPTAGPSPDGDRDLAVAGVAHDVNQMLTVIAGRVEVLRLRGRLAAEDLDAIALAARDAAAMLRRLGPAVPADPRTGQTADVAACVTAATLVHRPPDGARWADAATAPDALWTLAADVPPGLAAALPEQLLREVLGNLVANAVEAMGEGGRLTVVASAAGARVRLTVGDTGPGLAPGDRDRIFAAGWTTHAGAGRGVGLAASRQLLAAWGAELAAAEPGGGGAVFVLDLPAAAPVARANGGPDARTPVLAGPVLVVDDEPGVRQVLLDLLGARGLAVTVAADAAAAAAAWADADFAVALVDYTLPGVSGLELARRLRAVRPAAALVLMTGVDRRSELPPDADAVCDAVTTKPLDFSGLPALLAAAVARAAGRGGAGAHEEGTEPR